MAREMRIGVIFRGGMPRGDEERCACSWAILESQVRYEDGVTDKSREL